MTFNFNIHYLYIVHNNAFLNNILKQPISLVAIHGWHYILTSPVDNNAFSHNVLKEPITRHLIGYETLNFQEMQKHMSAAIKSWGIYYVASMVFSLHQLFL